MPNKKKKGREDLDTDGQWITCCCDRWDSVDSEGIDNITGVFVLFFNNYL